MVCLSRLRLLAVVAPFAVAACDAPTHLKLTVDAASRLNPDATGLSMPVQLHVYTLRSTAKFDSADYFTLTDSEKHALDGDLLATQEATIRPGTKQTFNLPLSDDAKYVGLVASFQMIDSAVWHASLPIPGSGKATGNLDRDHVTLQKAD